ncbi:MAG: replication initiation protein, partial [Clostridia bacterium]|nr:replication initiation protein [Clostridia bacterium]
KNIISLKSQYSIRLYPMLKDMPFGWTVELTELRKKLGATSSTYNEFKRFNDLILKKAIAGFEMLEPCYKKIKLSPSLYDLDFADFDISTPYGNINIKLSRNTSPQITAPEQIQIIK